MESMIPQQTRSRTGWCGRLLITLTFGVVFGLMVFSIGCGRQSAPTSGIDRSDGDAPVGAQTPEVSSAPGELEMPTEIAPESDPPEPAATGGIEMPKDVAVPVESGASVSPEIEYGSWQDIQSFAKSRGRVTVVDLWSLACEPCLKEFPGLVGLHDRLGSKVQCVAVDLDFDGRQTRPPEYYEDRVVAFLESVNASGFPMYISTTPSDDVFAEAGLPSIPAVLVFDHQGNLAKVFVDAGESAGFTYEKDVVPFVKKLIG